MENLAEVDDFYAYYKEGDFGIYLASDVGKSDAVEASIEKMEVRQTYFVVINEAHTRFGLTVVYKIIPAVNF